METPQLNPAGLPELYEAVYRLHAWLELDEVINHALQAAIKLVNAERAFIKINDKYLPYTFPAVASEMQQHIATSLNAVRQDSAQSQQGLLITNTQDNPRFAVEPLSALFTSRTLLIVPVRAKAAPSGSRCPSPSKTPLLQSKAIGAHSRESASRFLASVKILTHCVIIFSDSANSAQLSPQIQNLNSEIPKGGHLEHRRLHQASA